MSLADAFAPVEAEYARRVQASTWGHLEPTIGRHKGKVTFGCDYYGNVYYLEINFKFPGGPRFHEHLVEYFSNLIIKDKKWGTYIWHGTYQRFKNGKGRFGGKSYRARIVQRGKP